MEKTLEKTACILLFALLISTFILTSSTTSADDPLSSTVSANAAVVVPSACTFVSVNDEPHSATIPAGTFRETIGYTTFTTTCNDANGYAVYAVGYTNNEYGNTKLLATIGGVLDPTKDIITGTSSSGTTSNWGMRLSQVSSPGTPPTIASDTNGSFGSMHIVPSTYTKIANYSSSVISGSSFKVTYDAFIAGSQPAGNYNGRVRYTMVHPQSEVALGPQTCASGYICYYPNGSNVVGTMGRQSVTSSATSATLIAPNFSREGYGFAGWTDNVDYKTDPNAHFYGPNEAITFTAEQYDSPNNGLSLYAIWIPSAGNLQDTSKVTQLCGTGGTGGSLTTAVYNDENDADESTWSISAGLSSVSALTDTRDNQTYAIAKLTDDKCWMIENLRLADTHQENNTAVPTTLTVANTNNPLHDTTTNIVTLKHNYSDTTTYTNLSSTSSGSTSWCTSTDCFDQSRLRTDNTANRASYTTTQSLSANANLYSYGNYYNWYSATAGNGTYSKAAGDTTGDLCPYGWHLPTSNGSGEFGLLSNSLGGKKSNSNAAQSMNDSTNPTGIIMSKRLRHFPNNFIQAGSAESGNSLTGRGWYGKYSSSTSSGYEQVRMLDFSVTDIFPGVAATIRKSAGTAIRCIVD